jgi:hypothetical protein
MGRALCKLRGCLVIAEITKRHPEQSPGQCPFCGSETFHKYDGWLECDNCSFAIRESDYEKIINELPPFLGAYI